MQAISLEKAVISFNLDKQRAFKPGQLHIVLSRITNLSGTYLTGSYCRAEINSKNAAERRCERPREQQPLRELLLSDIQ